MVCGGLGHMTTGLFGRRRLERVALNSLCLSVALFPQILLATTASAQTSNFNGVADWSQPGNWSAGVPTNGWSAIIQTGTAHVSGNAGAVFFTVGEYGTAALSVSGYLLNQDSTTGRYAGSIGTVSVTGGEWSNAGWRKIGEFGQGTITVASGGTIRNTSAWLGYETGSSGTATITGAGSRWINSEDLYVGRLGTGVINILDGATVSSVSGLLGTAPQASGTATVSGTGSRWDASNRIDVGNGSITVSAGGTVTNENSAVGNLSGGSGSVIVEGVGSRWSTSNGLSIGHTGQGDMTVRSGGVVEARYAVVGERSGTIGALTITGAGSTFKTTDQIYLGRDGGASLLVEQGGRLETGVGIIGEGTGNTTATAEITGSGSSWASSGAITVGYGGAAKLTISDGANVDSKGGNVGAAARGEVTISGPGSAWTNTGNLRVAHSSSGSVTVAGGGRMTSATAQIGSSTIKGEVRLAGAQSSWANLGVVDIGKGALTLGGAGDAAAEEAGTFSASWLNFWNSDGSGELIFNHTGSGYAFTTPMAGTGTIKHMAGRTLLGGDSSAFLGTTTVSGGELQLNGKLGGNADIVAGLLSGTGTLLGNLDVRSGAQLGPGSSIGTLTVEGNLNLASGSLLHIETYGQAADRINVDGDVTANGTSVRVSSTGGTYANITDYTVLSADGSIAGSFDVSTDLYFLTPTLKQTGNDLVLTLARNDFRVASLAQGGDQGQVASVIDGLGMGNPIYDTFMRLGAADASQLLNAISGSSHGSGQQVLDQTFALFSSSLGGRTSSAPRASGGPSMLGYVEVAPQVAAIAAIGEATIEPAASQAAWLAPIFGVGIIEASAGVSGTHWSSGGLTGGYEFSTSLPQGVFLAGIALGYQQSAAKTGSNDFSSATGMVAAYGSIEHEGLAVSGSLLYGVSHVDSKRFIVAPGLDMTATSDYWGHSLGVSGEIGYALPMGPVTLSPLASLDASLNQREGFTETGAGAFGLSSAGEISGELNPGLGLEIKREWQLEAGVVQTRARALWQHQLLDAKAQEMSFVGGGASFQATGNQASRDKLIVGAGLSFSTPSDVHLFADYDGQFSDGRQQHGVRLGAKAGF
jgi:T5SS/PEP-CTERM-associated repeat protein